MKSESGWLGELLRRAGRGDAAAFEALYEETAAKLLGVTLRICGERALAEDALQEAYVSIWRSAPDYSADRGAPLAWMAGIARNRAIDALRRRGGRGRWADGEEGERLLAETEAASRDHAEIRAITQCLGGLEEQHREAVLLAYCAGWTREELAARYGAPENTVKTWLRRSLIALRACLEGR